MCRWDQSSGPKLRWCENAKREWLCLIATRVDNGVSSIDVLLKDNTWHKCEQQYILGQMFNLPSSLTLQLTGGKYTVRILDRDGVSYGSYMVTEPGMAPFPVVTDAV